MRRTLSTLAVTCALLGGAAPAHAALGPGVTQTVLLSNPPAATAKVDYSIHAELTRMVDATPAGATITQVIWGGNHPGYWQAIVRACKRGVKYQAVQTGERNTPQLDAARAACGTATWKRCRRVLTAGIANGCLSDADRSYVHGKAITFSQTGTRKYVVVDGTTNMTLHGGESNNMVVTAGSACLYRAYRLWMDDLRSGRVNRNYIASPNGTETCPDAAQRVLFTPESGADSIATQLRRYTYAPGCSMRYMHRFIDMRPAPLAELVRLDRAGCPTTVITDTISVDHARTLAAGGVQVRATQRTWTLPDGRQQMTRMHEKGWVFTGRIDGTAGRREAVTGSQNALYSYRRADESMMVLTHPATVARFDTAFANLERFDYQHPHTK